MFDDQVFADNPPLREDEGFVAWPPRGFVPQDLVHPRWSFGLADANFDNATVTMTSGDRTIELTVVARLSQQGYVPAPIIVWEPEADSGSDDTEPARGGAADGATGGGDLGDEVVQLAAAHDTSYDIVVDGVIVDGAEVSFAYTVTIMADDDGLDPFRFPTSPMQLAFRATGEAVQTVATGVLRTID